MPIPVGQANLHTMTIALEGLKVLDLSHGPATGIATMILADFGADVVRVIPPDSHPLDSGNAAPMWKRGKREICLDLDTEPAQATLHELLAKADVFVVNWRSRALEQRALDYANIKARYPHLIYCHISGFGSQGPKADYPGYEHVVAAASGRMLTFSGIVDRKGPVFSALQVGTHATAQSTLTGILAAVFQRTITGKGRLVETSMLQGMLPYEQGALIGQQFEQFSHLYAQANNPEPPMPSLFYHPAQAGDGRWVQFGNLLPHLFDNFLVVTDLIDIIGDPDFDEKQLYLRDPEKHEAFRARMLSRIQEKSAEEWMDACVENGGIVAGQYQTTQEALDDPDIVANGHVIQREDGKQLGPLATLSDTPANPGPPTTLIAVDEIHWHTTEVASNTAGALDDDNPTTPLRGVKVLEIATIIAAPLGASFLADLGAEVTKIEQIGGDPYRGLAMGVGSARVNAGKRSISLNLKSKEGQAIALKLAAEADIVIHNYRPGVPERLGIGYEAIKAVNPEVIYLQSNGYGPDGPGALRPSTHPIPGAAMGGVVYQMGERLPTDLQDIDGLKLWTKRLMRANEVNPDPNTALVIASSALLGLTTREIHGKGQRIYVDMFGANAYANHDDFLNYADKPHRPLPDENLYGLNATYRLYECADEQWVFLALVTDKEHTKFVTLIETAGFASPSIELLQQCDATTAAALTELFSNQSADAWEALLASDGIGCVRADRASPVEFWLNDPQSHALGMTQPQSHPAWGDYLRHGSNLRFERSPPSLKPPPLAGQHAEEILAHLNFTKAEIDALIDQGIVFIESAVS